MASLKTNSFLKALRKCLMEDEYYSQLKAERALEKTEKEKEKDNEA